MRNLKFFADRLAAPVPIAIPSFRQPIYPTGGMVTSVRRAAQVPLAAIEWGVGHDCAQCMFFFRCHGNNRRIGRMRRAWKPAASE